MRIVYAAAGAAAWCDMEMTVCVAKGAIMST